NEPKADTSGKGMPVPSSGRGERNGQSCSVRRGNEANSTPGRSGITTRFQSTRGSYLTEVADNDRIPSRHSQKIQDISKPISAGVFKNTHGRPGLGETCFTVLARFLFQPAAQFS